MNSSFKNDSNYLDQHFLIDEDIINKFIDSCNLNKNDIVVEIGPGLGDLTQIIVSKVKSLTVIEIDQRLNKYLETIPGIKIINESVLDIDIPKCDKIITALPYSIIEPFIYKLRDTDFQELYMIMGSNYVNNVINKEINNLSLLTNTFFEIKKYFDITPEAFNPPPRTVSSAIRLIKKTSFSPLDLIYKNLYELNRKKIKNALMETFINIKKITKKESKAIINGLDINDNILNKCFCNITNNELKELDKKLSLFVKE